VVHHYYDHRIQQYRRQELSQEEMLRRYISHIPDRHFKMVRYYGFLSNRKRTGLLTQVYAALEREEKNTPEKPGYASGNDDFISRIRDNSSVIRHSAQKTVFRG